jgi:hypothetical protein
LTELNRRVMHATLICPAQRVSPPFPRRRKSSRLAKERHTVMADMDARRRGNDGL